MKKTIINSVAILLLSVFSFGSVGCFGNFSLTRKVYTWNEGIGGDDLMGRFVKTLVFYGMCIIPIYGVAGLVDVVILNLVEFWTGSNPVAMKAGEVEQRVINHNGIKYEVTATQNNFHIVPLEGVDKGKVTDLTFDPATQSWTVSNEKGSQKIVDVNGSQVSFHSPKGVVTKGLATMN